MADWKLIQTRGHAIRSRFVESNTRLAARVHAKASKEASEFTRLSWQPARHE